MSILFTSSLSKCKPKDPSIYSAPEGWDVFAISAPLGSESLYQSHFHCFAVIADDDNEF